MTYGWAILIIAVVLGALFQLGVFNSSSFSPRAPPGACQVFRPGGPGTTTNINLMGVCTGQLPQYVAQFNGQNSNILIGNSAVLNPTFITVSSWINTNANGVWQRAVNKGDPNAGLSDPGYELMVTSTDKISFTVNGITALGTAGTVSSFVIKNTWYHAVGTYDGSNIRLYVNGVLLDQPALVAGSFSNAYDLRIGARRQLATQFFSGLIENVQIYNISLTANQVQALYLEGIGGAPMKLQNLAGWWPLNGNSNDYSGNNNNGVPTAVTFTSQYGK